jgi:hypothetical protein
MKEIRKIEKRKEENKIKMKMGLGIPSIPALEAVHGPPSQIPESVHSSLSLSLAARWDPPIGNFFSIDLSPSLSVDLAMAAVTALFNTNKCPPISSLSHAYKKPTLPSFLSLLSFRSGQTEDDEIR